MTKISSTPPQQPRLDQQPPRSPPPAPSSSTGPKSAPTASAPAKNTATVKRGDVFASQGAGAANAPVTLTAARIAQSPEALKTASILTTNPATPQNPVVRNVTFTFDAGNTPLTNLQLKGSFNKTTGEFDPNWGGGDAVPMKPLGDGRWQVTLPISDDGQVHKWQWGVVADGPAGKGQWAVMGENPLSFDVGPDAATTPSYAPTTYSRMGAHKQPNGDLSFQFWAPDAKAVNVKVVDQKGNLKRYTMKENADGTWSANVPNGFSKLEGMSYSYELTTSEGTKVDRPDPYATTMQGEQRGLSREFIDVRTGKEVTQYFVQPDLAAKLAAKYGSYDAAPQAEKDAAMAASRAEFMRFEIDSDPKAAKADLVLTDASGHQLTKAELLAKLGGAIDSKMDPSLATKLRGGTYNDLWSQNVDADGTIHLTNEDGTFNTFVNNCPALEGLHYTFKTYDQSGKLLGDSNHDGKLSSTEAKGLADNDPWDNTIDSLSGITFRNSVITDDSTFQFKNDQVPRETDHRKWVIEQVHTESFFASPDDSRPGTLQDLTKKLQYFKDLGINTIELLPTNEVEGNRDWGYMGANSLATESALGFQNAHGQWVTGTEALKEFIDAAHGMGLNVMNDVVYNHVGGVDNGLWNLDGKNNPYFNWSTTPGQIVNKDTPWGAMPAYDNPKVSQFFVDHAVSQVTDLHFDGLRFDFTQPIKDPSQGGQAGWDLLRNINRQLHFYNPNVFTAAEQFDYDPNMTKPAQDNEQGGAGFDAQWYTQFQHTLVHDNGNPSIIQQAVNGQQTNMDAFVNMLTNPRGISGWQNAVTIISDHDEVGNGQRTINVADSNAQGLPSQWARNVDRFAAGMGFMSPGIPMFFQGDESMAQNTFQWGEPSTWGLGWDWQKTGQSWNWNQLTFNDQQKATYERLAGMQPQERTNDPAYKALSVADKQVCDDLCAMSPKDRADAELNIARKQTYEFYQDAIKLRQSNPAFDADAQVNRIYTHNDNSVLAFERKKGDSDFIVVGSLNKNSQQGYQVPLPPGQWKEVFNSDGAKYGGGNVGNFGATLTGGNTPMNLPAGGYIVLQKVG